MMQSPRAQAAALLAFALTLAVPSASRAQGGGGAKPAAPEKTVLKLGTLAPEGTPWADLLEEFKRNVEAESKGEIKVKVFLNGRQGDEPEMLAKVAAKKLDGGGFTSSGLAALVPEMAVLELPFLFDDDAEADHVMDAVIRDDLARAFEAKGLHLYVWAVNGWVDFGSAKREVRSLEDLKASKPYTRESKARQAFWAALGVTPAVVPVPEVPAALKAGKVDLYDTTPLFATAAGWFSETKHWTDSNHIYQPAAIVFDLAWWKGLPEPLRKTLDGLAGGLQANARKSVRGLDASLLDGFRKQGVAVHALSAEGRAEMRKATASVAAEMVKAGDFSKELHEKVAKGLDAFRAARAAKPEPKPDPIAVADRCAAARPALDPLQKGEQELSGALAKDAKSFEATWRMARMQYYLGKHGPADARIERYQGGIDWAKKAIALDASRVEGHFWLGVLYGVFGEAKGITSSLFLVGDMRKALERANEIDPTFDAGGPPRVLGRLSFKLPWVAGGSNKDAMKYLRKALELDATMPYTYTYLAEVLIAEDEEDEARQLLQKLIAMPPPPAYACEHQEMVEQANKLLEKIR